MITEISVEGESTQARVRCILGKGLAFHHSSQRNWDRRIEYKDNL